MKKTTTPKPAVQATAKANPKKPTSATTASAKKITSKAVTKPQIEPQKADSEAIGPSKEEIREAARILKTKGSKKRERRQAASVMSAAGSRKGGTNRAKNLTQEQRTEIARLGGLARQAKGRERVEQGLPHSRPRKSTRSSSRATS